MAGSSWVLSACRRPVLTHARTQKLQSLEQHVSCQQRQQSPLHQLAQLECLWTFGYNMYVQLPLIMWPRQLWKATAARLVWPDTNNRQHYRRFLSGLIQ